MNSKSFYKRLINQTKETIRLLKEEMGNLDPHEPDFDDFDDLRFILDDEEERLRSLKVNL